MNYEDSHRRVTNMIKKSNPYYWLFYMVSSRNCKMTGIEMNPYTNQVFFEMEI